MTLFHSSIIMLLMGHLFLGISHIALLPPWEGFDETAHFSYIQQIADTGSLPDKKRARLSKTIEAYKNYAPIAYSGIPPFEDNGGYTYKTFFNSHPKTLQKGSSCVHLPPDRPRRYTPGTTYNWQAQHPPLYYLLLSPVYRATRTLPLFDQIFLLRLLSYIFAWSALLITAYAGFLFYHRELSIENRSIKHLLPMGVVSIPIFFPAWFPAMARIGNDSLCALILSVLWLLVLRVIIRERCSIRISVLIGVFLGLGCLTKAFFMPLSVGILAFLSLQNYTKENYFNKFNLLQILLIAMFTFIISGWWYLGNLQEGGSLLGSHEITMLNDSGGIIKGLSTYFSLRAWIRGHAALVATLAWSGTWSWIRPPYIFFTPLAISVTFITISYLTVLRRHKINTIAWLSLWIALPVVIGFSYHVLVRIALTGEGRGTGGYYLLFMVPVIGSAISFCLGSIWQKKKYRFIFAALGSYAISFSMVITWAQILMFSGIIYKSGENKFYQFPDHLPPYFGISDALTNLSILVYPKFGALCWISGGILLTIGVISAWTFMKK